MNNYFQFELYAPDNAEAIIVSISGIIMFMKEYSYPIQLRKSNKEQNEIIVSKCISCYYHEHQICLGGISNIKDGICYQYNDWNSLLDEYIVVEAILPKHFVVSDGRNIKMFYYLDDNKVHPFTMLGNVSSAGYVCTGDVYTNGWNILNVYQNWLDAKHNGDYFWFKNSSPSEMANNWINSIENKLIREFNITEFIGNNPKVLEHNKQYLISNNRNITGYKSIRKIESGYNKVYLLEKQ